MRNYGDTRQAFRSTSMSSQTPASSQACISVASTNGTRLDPADDYIAAIRTPTISRALSRTAARNNASVRPTTSARAISSSLKTAKGLRPNRSKVRGLDSSAGSE